MIVNQAERTWLKEKGRDVYAVSQICSENKVGHVNDFNAAAFDILLYLDYKVVLPKLIFKSLAKMAINFQVEFRETALCKVFEAVREQADNLQHVYFHLCDFVSVFLLEDVFKELKSM